MMAESDLWDSPSSLRSVSISTGGISEELKGDTGFSLGEFGQDISLLELQFLHL